MRQARLRFKPAKWAKCPLCVDGAIVGHYVVTREPGKAPMRRSYPNEAEARAAVKNADQEYVTAVRDCQCREVA